MTRQHVFISILQKKSSLREREIILHQSIVSSFIFFCRLLQLFVWTSLRLFPLRYGCRRTYCERIVSEPRRAADVIRRSLFVTPDVDECKSSEAVCSEYAVCTNTVGSYVCACAPGYSGDARTPGGCRDVNECEIFERPCGTYAVCENADPGYNCVCPQGYRAKPDPQIACEQVILHIMYLHRIFKPVLISSSKCFN